MSSPNDIFNFLYINYLEYIKTHTHWVSGLVRFSFLLLMYLRCSTCAPMTSKKGYTCEKTKSCISIQSKLKMINDSLSGATMTKEIWRTGIVCVQQWNKTKHIIPLLEIKTAHEKDLLTWWLWPHCAFDSLLVPNPTNYHCSWVMHQPITLNTAQSAALQGRPKLCLIP